MSNASNASNLSNMTTTGTPTNTATANPVTNNTVNNTKNEKQKIFKLKEGQVLRYKKRLFSSNWQPTQLTLYNNGTFSITTPKRSAATPIQCQKNSTLIIFGQSLDFIPKRPIPANGYKKEHMLAIGLINYAYSAGGKLKGVQVIFYWFSLGSQDEMIEWVVAFQNSLYSDSHAQNMKSNPDIQTLTNNIALTNAYNVLNLNSSLNPTLSHIDELSYGLLMGMANTTNIGAGLGTIGTAAVGAGAGFLAANQLTSGDAINLIDQLNPTRRINQYLGSYLNDDSTVYYIGDNGMFSGFASESGGGTSMQEGCPIAEIGTLLNAGMTDFGLCSFDCAVDAGGGDCGFDIGDMSALAII